MADTINIENPERMGGEPDAQNASPAGVSQLQQSPQNHGVPQGEGSAAQANADGAEGQDAGAGTPGKKASVQTDKQEHTPQAEAAAKADEGHADAQRAAEEAAQRATARLGEALAHAALRDAGVPGDRAARALRLMELDRIDPMAEDAHESYASAAQKLIAEFPEFVPAHPGTGASGEHPRRASNDDTAANFRRGMGR